MGSETSSLPEISIKVWRPSEWEATSDTPHDGDSVVIQLRLNRRVTQRWIREKVKEGWKGLDKVPPEYILK